MEQDSMGRVGDRIPDAVIKKEAQKIMNGPCPECNQISHDVELRYSYRAVSYLVMTTWSKIPILACRSCHRKKVAGDTLTTVLFGWWGFPFGLIVTPVQLLRNMSAAGSPNSRKTEPSADLCSFVRGVLAQKLIENSSQQVSSANGTIRKKKIETLKSAMPPPVPGQVAGPKAKPIEPR